MKPSQIDNQTDQQTEGVGLFGELAEKQRADQLGINCRWLIDSVSRSTWHMAATR